MSPAKTARNAMMDLLARRNHSEAELRRKLQDRFTPDAITSALRFARQRKLLPDPQTLAQQFADQLHRRNQGILLINHKLQEKGLPRVKPDPEVELEKALRLAQTKLSRAAELDLHAREKLGRFLVSKGFEQALVRKVIYEKL